ncbi:hypothetical protein AB1A65_11870 [Muricauda sp. ANG21]|uniref:hypothetical protein n=1 Tax=Allomuricauda sp. ANG21 TaxID=3042468 RepID=UPI0034550871
MDVFKEWKLNILERKWNTVQHTEKIFSEKFINEKINIIKSFFHADDLTPPSKNSISNFSITNPSNLWIIFLLKQRNMGSYELLIQICEVIEFFLEKDPEYLTLKLLQSDGRINKKAFRNDFFEVWLNYWLYQQKIKVDLKKCYRNDTNPYSEGFDSAFITDENKYIVECLKLQSWNEEVWELSYQMIRNVYIWQEKLSRTSQPFFDSFTILAEPNAIIHDGGVELRKHLKQFIKNKEELYISSSQSFSKIFIFKNDNSNDIAIEKSIKNKNRVKLVTKFVGYEAKDVKGNILIDFDPKSVEEKVFFNISAESKLIRSPKKFEEHLIKKVKKKIAQHRDRLNHQKLIIAIELETFNGLTAFPIKTIENFENLKKLTSNKISILVFFKNSQGENLEIKSQHFHLKGDEISNLFY